jgi:hypothetical protein
MVLPLDASSLAINVFLELFEQRFATRSVLGVSEVVFHLIKKLPFVDCAVQFTQNLFAPIVEYPIGCQRFEPIQGLQTYLNFLG